MKELKPDFPLFSLTLLDPSDLQNSPVYQSTASSLQCLNLDIDWSPDFFARIREAFQKPSANEIKFRLTNFGGQKHYKTQDKLESLLEEETAQPCLELYFLTGKGKSRAEVLLMRTELH